MHGLLQRGHSVTRLSAKSIGAEVTGMTACPCAQNIMKDRANQVLEHLGVNQKTIDAFFAEVPMATHNQRGPGIPLHRNR